MSKLLVNPLDFFSESEKVVIPVGGGGGNRGFVAPWNAAVMYSVGVEMAIDDEFKKKYSVSKVRAFGGSGKSACYFKDYASAKVLSTDTGGYSPNTEWVFETDIRKIINTKDPDKLEAAFGRYMFWNTNMAGLGSKKNRHVFHLIALPSAVSAVARMYGLDVPQFDLSEIAVAEAEFIATDELQFALIGHPDVTDRTDSKHYANSIYGKRRAELWKLLGEEDAWKCHTKGSKDVKGNPSKFATESDDLSSCLMVAGSTWTKAIWCRLETVLNPMLDAKGKDKEDRIGKRLTIPVISEMWATEAQAREVATVAHTEGNGAGNDALVATDSMPEVPAAWAEMVDDFAAAVGDAFSSGKSAKDVAAEVEAPLSVVVKWKKYLQV